MNNNDFTKKILHEISDKKVAPIPRWYFIFKEYLLIGISVIAIIVGGMAIGLVLLVLMRQDWFAIPYLDEGFVGHTLQIIPYSLVIISGIIAIGTTMIIRHIRRGYRFPLWKTISIVSVASIFLAVLFLSKGTSHTIDRWLSQAIPTYQETFEEDTIWQYPEQGLLSGEITSIGADSFTITDTNDNSWSIIITEKLLKKKTTATVLTQGNTVKIIGTMQNGSHFTATELFPWNDDD